MKELIEELYLTNRALVSDDFDAALEHIQEEYLPLTVHEYPSGAEIWDSWIVPQKWEVEHGYVETRGGDIILDYEDHPLHVITYSAPFEGWVSREELIEHVYTHPRIDDAIPYHFRLNYRPWESEWGFCASRNFVESLTNEEYFVSVDTTFEDGLLKVGEHHLPGQRDETILLIAHLDHVGMANDDLSGISVGVEVMNRLGERDSRSYSYKLLLVPEIIGSVAYLDSLGGRAGDLEYGMFLETLGNDNRILLQNSLEEDTRIDRVTEFVLRREFDDYEVKRFRESAGDDEFLFESPGFEIPTVSISRYPYEEYHTDLDDPSIISEERLQKAAGYVLDVVDVFERDFVPVRTFEGIPSLANPKYDLYIDPGQPGLSGSTMADANLSDFRDRVFRCLEGDMSVFDIAEYFDLEFDFVYEYLLEFEEKGLVDIDGGNPAFIGRD